MTTMAMEMTPADQAIADSRQAFEELQRKVYDEAVGLMEAHPEWDLDAANASLARVGLPPLGAPTEYTLTIPLAVSFTVSAISAEQAAQMAANLVGQDMKPDRFLLALARKDPTEADITGPVRVS